MSELKVYVGKVHESQGKNRSPEIDSWNKRAHCPVGSPYCLSSSLSILDDVCKKQGWRNPIGVKGGTQEFFSSSPTHYKTQSSLPGVFAIFQSKEDASHGHCAPVTGPYDIVHHTFQTTEFNTDATGGRDGDGCYNRVRSVFGDARLKLRGFVDVSQWIADANTVKS